MAKIGNIINTKAITNTSIKTITKDILKNKALNNFRYILFKSKTKDTIELANFNKIILIIFLIIYLK